MKYYSNSLILHQLTQLISCIKYTEPATEFAFSLLQTLVIEERGVISELPNLVDAMAKVFFLLYILYQTCVSLIFNFLNCFNLKIASKPGSPESLQQLIEIVKNPAAAMDAVSVTSLGKEDKTKQARDKKVKVEFGFFPTFANIFIES